MPAHFDWTKRDSKNDAVFVFAGVRWSPRMPNSGDQRADPWVIMSLDVHAAGIWITLRSRAEKRNIVCRHL